jgi:large subunit ribosomal protein L6
MSHIGKQPISLAASIEVTIVDRGITIKGPKGTLSLVFDPRVRVEKKDQMIVCSISETTKQARMLWGTTRARIANAVQGVLEGFEKKLEMRGVGYRAHVKGKNLELSVGFSHPVVVPAPEHIQFSVEKEVITVSGIDNQLVGQVAADIKAVRPPEPYKGKGIRYLGEYVRQKQGKVVGATSA